jgi:8-oxo-dGTP pyrophosphatase MutT (NUDIX family)
MLIRGSANLPMDPTQCSILMIRRKDSMSFTEFLRGKYSTHPPEYLGVLLSNMTQPEQQMIRTQPFDTLWTRLWGYGVEHHYNEYPQARQQFDMLDINALLETYPSIYTEPEWGFPKGRRVRCETDIECATREFFEETNIPRDSYAILKGVVVSETFRGTNGVMYKHIYHVAIVTDASKIQLDQKFTTMQRREISAISWKSLEECSQLSRPHYVDRARILSELKDILLTFETHAMTIEQ